MSTSLKSKIKKAFDRNKTEYYSTAAIDKYNATYNLIIGERSNGKTYALLKKVVENYVEHGKQFAYVRRWQVDVRGSRASSVFAGLMANDEIHKITHGKFDGVHYYAGKFYLCTYNDEGKAIYGDQDILGFTFAISDNEHNKSTSYPHVNLIVFDEFLTSQTYLPDEFVGFMNTVSTIVRRRTNVKIYMLANTVNKYAPYFNEMGLTNITTQKQGTIDIYRYGSSDLTVAVEYCAASSTQDNEAHKYFAFDNPKLAMITGGAWELSIYPHLPHKYKPKNVELTFYMEFNAEVFQGDCVSLDGMTFIYIHRKKGGVKYPETDLVYSLDYVPRFNYNRNLFKPIGRAQERIAWHFIHDRVFYSDNSVGDSVKNLLNHM